MSICAIYAKCLLPLIQRVKKEGEGGGGWRPRFTKSFMLLAHNSTRLCLLEFGLSIFVVSCSSLSEVRQCRI